MFRVWYLSCMEFIMFWTAMKVLGPTEQPKSAIRKGCSHVKFWTPSFSAMALSISDVTTSASDFYIRPIKNMIMSKDGWFFRSKQRLKTYNTKLQNMTLTFSNFEKRVKILLDLVFKFGRRQLSCILKVVKYTWRFLISWFWVWGYNLDSFPKPLKPSFSIKTYQSENVTYVHLKAIIYLCSFISAKNQTSKSKLTN